MVVLWGNSALHWCWQYVVESLCAPALGYMFGGSLHLYMVYQLQSLWQISKNDRKVCITITYAQVFAFLLHQGKG